MLIHKVYWKHLKSKKVPEGTTKCNLMSLEEFEKAIKELEVRKMSRDEKIHKYGANFKEIIEKKFGEEK